MLTLSQASASQWGAGGTGFTTYTYTWIAPDTSSTVLFQFYSTSTSVYWDLDDVSVKDSFGTEIIINGNFASSTSSWNQTCSISSCATTPNYGPGSTPAYVVNCDSATNYYSVSQTFTTVACMNYTITFELAVYRGLGTSNFHAYIF